jgi:hypothetical protein
MDEKDHCARGLFNARITTVFIFTAVITDDRMVKLLENRSEIIHFINNRGGFECVLNNVENTGCLTIWLIRKIFKD